MSGQNFRVLDTESFGPFDKIVECLMAALLLFSPLAFGTTEAWSQEIVFGLITLMVICLFVRSFVDRSTHVAWTWAYLPVALFVLLVIAQLVPFPAAAVKLLSPATVDVRTRLLSDLTSVTPSLDHQRISLYAAATNSQLRLVIALAAVFVIVVNFYRSRAAIKRLLAVIAVVGMVVAVIALDQNIFGRTTVYGVVPAVHLNSGPFMNHSHFGQFMNLSIGATLALLLVRLAEMAAKYGNASDVFERLRKPNSWFLWLLTVACVVLPISVLLSMTRMGAISMLVAAAITVGLLAWRNPSDGNGPLIIAIALMVFAILLAIGFEEVYSRLATLRHIASEEGSRMQTLRDMTAIFSQFPMFGTGLGTHEFVFPMFDHSNVALLATHAENEYAQLMEETGAVGVALFLVFFVYMFRNFLIAIWKPRRSIQFAAYGIGFGLIAVILHSASDFGQHVPANALLTAVFAGLLFNIVKLTPRANAVVRSPAAPAVPERLWLLWPARVGASIAAVAIAGSVLVAADESRRAEELWIRATNMRNYLEADDWQGSDEDYTALLEDATAAAELMPDNVAMQYWLNTYRWHSISRNVDSDTNQVIMGPTEIEYASRIVDELDAARPLCPTYGPLLCVAGQIEYFVLDREIGIRHIEQSLHLTPHDPTVSMVAGTLAAKQQDWARAERIFRHAMALGGLDEQVINAYVGAGRPDLAFEMCSGKRENYLHLSRRLDTDLASEDAPIVAACLALAEKMLLDDARNGTASPGALAELADLYARRGQNVDAIVWYRKAVDQEFGQVEWRLRLVKLLKGAGQIAEAKRQVKICLQLKQSKEANSLFVDLDRLVPTDGPASRSDEESDVARTAAR